MENTQNNIQNNQNQPNKGAWMQAVSLGLELGFIVAIPLVIFLAAGIFLDKKLGTLPLFLIIGLLLNGAVTIVGVKKLLLPFLEKRSQDKINKN